MMSVIDLNSKVSEEMLSGVLPSNSVAEGSGKREGTAQIIPSGEPAVATQTEQANHDFYLQAKQIDGAQVDICGGESWSERTIIVAVPDLFASAADEIFDLKVRIHQQYPQGRLDVLVKPSPMHNLETP